MAKSLPCPACKFPNFVGAAVCLLCKSSLAGVEATELVPQGAGGASSRTAIVFLCCHPLPPIAIEPGGRYSVGRTKSADITLPHHSISRRHGLVRASDHEVRYVDESSNGSFLNGKRVQGEVELRMGDVLTIGPYDLHVSEDPVSESHDDPLDRTSELDFASLVSGLLEEDSIMDLLQGIEFNRKSGTLSLISGRLRGTLVVRDGQPWFARLGELRDDEAVLKMLTLEAGRYMFSSTVEDGPRTMQQRLTPLLFEASRQADEDSSATHLDRDPPTMPR
ncbi:MAG: DUF4388 domain-containing protein [Planctomycetota bacterium]